MNLIPMTDWRFVPEGNTLRLHGKIDGHPNPQINRELAYTAPELRFVTSSPVIAVDGRIVTTRSGTQYRLV